jgi:hypothetical protein
MPQHASPVVLILKPRNFFKIVRRALLVMVWKERPGVRTNRVVFEHAQRLMRSRPLHCAIVARHGHRDEAHHDGT